LVCQIWLFVITVSVIIVIIILIIRAIGEFEKPGGCQLVANPFVIHAREVLEHVRDGFVLRSGCLELTLKRLGVAKDTKDVSVRACSVNRDNGVILSLVFILSTSLGVEPATLFGHLDLVNHVIDGEPSREIRVIFQFPKFNQFGLNRGHVFHDFGFGHDRPAHRFTPIPLPIHEHQVAHGERPNPSFDKLGALMATTSVELGEGVLKPVVIVSGNGDVSVVGVSDGDVIHNKESVTLVYILSNLRHGFRNDSFSDCPAVSPAALDFQLTRRSFGATGAIDATRAGSPFGHDIVKLIVPVPKSCRLISS
jgi:hypothetical protein